MMFWRCYNWIYSKVFNHSSQAMGVYMDFMRPLALGPEARNYYGVNMDLKISQYRKHNLYVKNHCPPDRLLIYKLGDGWEPLCKFLNKDWLTYFLILKFMCIIPNKKKSKKN